jgi:transcriptional regulator with XRE-family HTH domain
MKEQADLKSILKKGVLLDELDLERALILERKLRLMVKEQPTLAKDREQLRLIIKAYEKINWGADALVSNEKLKASEEAEVIAEQERIFLETRKECIKMHLVDLKLTQQDLGKILGHSKSYMSELMNGISPFSNRDLIVLHKLFDIRLECLIPTIISQRDRIKLKETIGLLNKPMLEDIDFVRMVLLKA